MFNNIQIEDITIQTKTQNIIHSHINAHIVSGTDVII